MDTLLSYDFAAVGNAEGSSAEKCSCICLAPQWLDMGHLCPCIRMAGSMLATWQDGICACQSMLAAGHFLTKEDTAGPQIDRSSSAVLIQWNPSHLLPWCTEMPGVGCVKLILAALAEAEFFQVA